MTPTLIRLQIDASDAYGDLLRAQLALAECRPLARPLRERMVRERQEQWERAKARLEAATMGRAP